MPVSAGQISIEAVFDDTAARAKAQKYASDMRALMASAGAGGPATATAGGGFFNRTGGGGQVAGAAGGGGFRPFSFDSEAEQVRGGLRTLARALYGQAIAIGQMNVGGGYTAPRLTGLIGGYGGGGGAFGAAGFALSAGEFGAAAGPAGLMGANVTTAAAAGGAEGLAVAGAAGSLGAGGSFARLGTRLARTGGFAIAAYGLHHLTNTIRENYLFDEKVNRMLAVGDLEGASQANLEKAKEKRSGLSGVLRAAFSYIGGTDYAAEEVAAQQSLDTLHAGRGEDTINLEVRRQDRSSRRHLLSGHQSSRQEALDLITSGNEDAERYRQQARHNTSPIAQRLLNFAADQTEASAKRAAFAIRFKDKEATDTTMIGLRGTLEEQLELNKLHPGQAHAMGIYNDAAMNVRDMLINSTRGNAEYARKIGIAQLQGFELHTIMSGNASAFDPFLEMAGPSSSKNTEGMAEILTKIHDEIKQLHNSLQDIGQTANPGDDM